MSATGSNGPATAQSNYGAVAAEPLDLTALEQQEAQRQKEHRDRRLYGPAKTPNGAATVTSLSGDRVETGINAAGTAKTEAELLDRASPRHMLALHRDTPVICANPTCGRRVKRRSRQQKYCSDRCRQMAHRYVVKPALGKDTRDDRNPPKNVNVSNILRGTKSRSILIRNAVQTEFSDGREWQRVVSPDGVVAFMTQLRRPSYSRRVP